nr:hypothetical protein [uncultured Chryseobacterium sp.]
MHCFTKKILIIFLFISTLGLSQTKRTQDKIYRLIRESDEYNGSNDLKSLQLANQASQLAEKAGSSRDRATSYLFVANALTSLGMFKESFVYLEKSLDEAYSKTDVLHQVTLKLIKSDNYMELDLYDQSLKELNEILNVIDKNADNPHLIFFKAQAIRSIGQNYAHRGKSDSALIYFERSEAVFKTLPKNDPVVQYYEIPNLYLIKGQTFLEKTKTDSAFHYLEKGFGLIQKDKDASFDKFYASFGAYYRLKKKYSRALDYYLRSLQEMEEHHIQDVDSRVKTFKSISEIYGLLNRNTEEEIFLAKSYKESEKLSEESKANIQKAVDHIINEKKKEISFMERQNQWIIIGIAVFSFLTIVLIYVWYRNKNLHKKKTIEKVTQELDEKKQLISEKDEESKELKIRINETFDQIIQLGKDNDPNFYTRFQEVYPYFQKKLLSIDPTLQTSELILLAYTYLDFKTKEVADYTFRSPRTIQNRKHLLRKKLDIPAKEDMTVWLRSELN